MPIRTVAAVFAVVWTLLLGAIALELRAINRHLAWVSAPIEAIAAGGRAELARRATETQEQTRERLAEERRAQIAEYADNWRRTLAPTQPAARATSRRAPQPTPLEAPTPGRPDR